MGGKPVAVRRSLFLQNVADSHQAIEFAALLLAVA